MSLQLFQGDLSPFAARVRIKIRAKGIKDIQLSSAPGGTGSPAYKQLNPTGKIPALLVDGRPSATIWKTVIPNRRCGRRICWPARRPD